MAYRNFTPEQIAILAGRFCSIANTLLRVQRGLTEAEIDSYRMQAGTVEHFLDKMEPWAALVDAQFTVDMSKAGKPSKGQEAARAASAVLEASDKASPAKKDRTRNR